MYNYWGYGLHIASEIEFPELLPATFDTPDVTISIGKVPEKLEGDEVVNKVRVSMTPTEYLQNIIGVAKYYAANGDTICIEPVENVDEKSVRLFMLSNAIAAVLHQRNMIPLHTSAVFYEDGVILFCGHSGAGKSTIATALQQKGYKVFTDDVCVLKEEDGRIVAIPSYPMMKLWVDSFAKTGVEMAEEDARLRPNLAKFGRYYHDDYETGTMPIKRVFLLSPHSMEPEPEIKKVPSLEAFNALQRNTYRHVQMNAMKKRNFHFAMVSKLAGSVPVYRISRPSHENTVEKMVAMIESNLRGDE